MCMGSLKKFMNETKPVKSYPGYYLMIENNNLCLLYERQRQDPHKQARAALIKAEHSFKLLVIDMSALGVSWYISLNIYHVLVIDTSAFAFLLTYITHVKVLHSLLYLLGAGRWHEGSRCSLLSTGLPPAVYHYLKIQQRTQAAAWTPSQGCGMSLQ